MAAPVEQLTMYYEDSVNHYTTAQTPFNKRSAFSGTLMPPTNALLQFNVKENRSTAGDFYYFHNEASDVSGYKKLLIAPSDVAKQNIVASISAGDPLPSVQLMGKWITEPGVPGFVGTINGGTWQTNLRQRRTVDGLNYTSTFTVRWYRYYYNEITETWTESGQIAFTIGGAATNTETTQTYTHSVISSTWGVNDRLVVKVWANLDEIGAVV